MKKIFKLTLVLVVIITVSAFTTKTNSADSGYKIGDVATDFELENMVMWCLCQILKMLKGL